MRFTAHQFAQAWHGALTAAIPTERDMISQSYLEYLQQMGKLRQLPEIVRSMQQIDDQLQQRLAVTVTSRFPISPEQIDPLLQKRWPGKRIAYTMVQDSTVIGGIRIQTHDQRIDLSLHGQLKALVHHMTQTF